MTGSNNAPHDEDFDEVGLQRLRDRTLLAVGQAMVPALSRHLRTVLSLYGDTRSGASDVAAEILRDYGLALQLFRLAHSAFFSAGGRQSLAMPYLVVFLGYDRVAESIRSMPHMAADGPRAKDFKKTPFAHVVARSVLAGTLAGEIAPRLGLNPFHATACAMFQSLGHVLLSHCLPEAYATVWSLRHAPSVSARTSRSLTGWKPMELGAVVAERWSLPTLMRLTIAPPRHYEKQVRAEARRLITLARGTQALLLTTDAKFSEKKQSKSRHDLLRALKIEDKAFSAALRRGLGEFERHNLLLHEVLWDQGLLPNLQI